MQVRVLPGSKLWWVITTSYSCKTLHTSPRETIRDQCLSKHGIRYQFCSLTHPDLRATRPNHFLELLCCWLPEFSLLGIASWKIHDEPDRCAKNSRISANKTSHSDPTKLLGQPGKEQTTNPHHIAWEARRNQFKVIQKQKHMKHDNS